MGQSKNLAKGQDWPGQPKLGTGRARIAKIRDGTRDKARKGRSKTGNEILKQKMMFSNRKMTF